MNSTETTETDAPTREEEFAFLFAQLVLQQSNMAMMLMGKLAHPENGKVIRDIEAARLFIDQLEMLEAKTKGNLTKEEETLLKQTLMTLRLNFVQSVEQPASPEKPKEKSEASSSASPGSSENPAPPEGQGTPSAEEEEHRKKFSKKY